MQEDHQALRARGVRAASRIVRVLGSSLLLLAAAPYARADEPADAAFVASTSPALSLSPNPDLGGFGLRDSGYTDETWYSPLARTLTSLATSARAARDAQRLPLPPDRTTSQGAVGLQLPLQLQVTANFEGTMAHDRDPRSPRSRTAPPVRMLDWTLQANLGLLRPITARTSIELGYRVIRNRSNFEIYDYDRSVWGLYLRTQLF